MRVWILVDLERDEMLLLISFLVDLFEKVDDLLGRLWLLLDYISVTEERNLSSL